MARDRRYAGDEVELCIKPSCSRSKSAKQFRYLADYESLADV